MCNNQSNILEILTTIIVTTASFVVIIQTVQISTKKELFLKIYFPLYKILSPFLYKKLSTEELLEIIKDIDNTFSNVEYIPFFISDHIASLRDGLSKGEVWQDTYIELCRHVDICCNRLCVLLGYPKRNLRYRFLYNQFSNNYKKWFAFAIYAIIQLMLAAVIVVIGVALFAWLLLLLKNALQVLQ